MGTYFRLAPRGDNSIHGSKKTSGRQPQLAADRNYITEYTSANPKPEN